MPNLTYTYRLLDKKCATLYYKLKSENAFATELFMPSVEQEKIAYDELHALQEQVEALDAPDPVYAILKEQLRNFLEQTKLLMDTQFNRPSKWFYGLLSAINYTLNKDSRGERERYDIIMGKLSKTSDLWQTIAKRLPPISSSALQELKGSLEQLQTTVGKLEGETFFSTLKVEALNRLKQQQETLLSLIPLWLEEVENSLQTKEDVSTKMTTDKDTVAFSESYFRELLEKEHGVNLDALLSWYEEEVEKTRKGVFAVVENLPYPEEKPTTMSGVNDLLNTYAGAFDTPEELMTKAKEYLNRAKEAARKVVPLPEEACILLPIPEQIKYSFPWGGYGGGCPLRRPLIGEYYVNDFNYTAVTDGWIKMMAIHESYPGHHVQFIRNTVDTLPEVVKIGARSTPIIEGTAHRSETVFAYIFAEDPFYPLFVAYRRHHTAVRIKAELWLRYFGKPIGEVVTLYMEELGFDRHTARGQVQAQEQMEGYFSCYYYGMKRIEDLGEQFGLDEEEYTRYLFDVGNVSLELLEAFLALSPIEKKRYTSEFASMIQFGE